MNNNIIFLIFLLGMFIGAVIEYLWIEFTHFRR